MQILWKSIKWGLLELVSRPIYVCAIILIPLFGGYFLLDFMNEGLPAKVPTAIVDLDQTHMSRKITSNLGDMEMIDVKMKLNSYTEARDAMQRGEIYAYYVIPRNFTKDLLSARQPEISYYYNYVYYIPATLAYKSFKTQAVLTSGAVMSTAANSLGIPASLYMPKLQPFVTDMHPLGNPWANYDIYLSNSFVPCLLALMIMIMTCYSLGMEIKNQTSRAWLENAGGSIIVATIGKLLPQTIIFSAVGILLQSMFYGYFHFPLNCSIWHMIIAMIFLVVACQSFALFMFSVLPHLRLSISSMSLIGILSFSIAGFSFPVEQMYGSIAIFSYILPIRYYFLIYVDQALNGIDLFYSRFYYIVLLIFTLLPLTMLWNMKRACLKQVYLP